MFKRMLLTATMFVAASTAAQAAIVLSEGFDDIGTLAGSGWAMINNSSPAGDTGWFQGNLFDAQAGAADSFIAANFLNADAGGGVISNWLLSPTLSIGNDTTLTFYTRTAGDLPFADRLEVRFSQNGGSTDVGGNSDSFGDFGSLVLTVNPALGDAYPSEWTQYSVTFSGLADGILGRIAFRYFVPDTTLAGNYIGIDSFQVSVPEPSTFALMLVALLPLGLAARRRKRDLKKWAIGASLAASTGIAAAEAPTDTAKPNAPGLMTFAHVQVVNAPQAAAQPAADKSVGVRVYIDPVTKQIREQTPEEAQQEAKSASARTVAKNARTAAAATSTTLYGPGNAVGELLGEESMIYSVAHKPAQGAPQWECVTGAKAATKALDQPTIGAPHTSEVRDER